MDQSEFSSDIHEIKKYLHSNRTQIVYTGVFIGIFSILALYIPSLAPIVAAAALVRPQKLLLFVATQYSFDESDWHNFSPILSNLTNYRFIGLLSIFVTIPIIHIFWIDLPRWDNQFGLFAFIITVVCLSTLIWSESFYKKNFYFNRWHALERTVVILFGILSLFSPVFIPLFLLVYWVIVGQFRHPEQLRLSFSWTHSSMQRNLLLILSGFVFVSTFTSINSDMVAFLLLSGFAAHYCIPGLAKIAEGPLYWIRHSNPTLLLLKVYEMGWLTDILRESTVLKIGRIGEKIKPILNISLLLLQLGVLFILYSQEVAIFLATCVFLFHIVVLLIDGDNFWRWMAIDLAVITGLILGGTEITLFGDTLWMLLFIGFVVSGRAWLKITKLGWLDTPYLEYYVIKVETIKNGTPITILPNNFQPYASMISTGCRGQFKYLDSGHRLVRTNGTSHNQKLHKKIRNSLFHSTPPDASIKEIKNKYYSDGYNEHDPKMGKKLGELLVMYAENCNEDPHILNKIKQALSAPAEYYTGGFIDPNTRIDPETIQNFQIHRVDGIWTSEGFHETNREKVLTVDL